VPASFLSSRSSVLRARPLVVGTLTGHGDLRGQLRRAASPLVDVVEVRLDTFPALYRGRPHGFSLDLLQDVTRRCRKPILLTLRHAGERGTPARRNERLSDAAREAIVAPLLPLVRLVDVEARRRGYARRVSALARRLGVVSIHSYHDFRRADVRGLDRWAARARAGGADLFKVAVTPATETELEAFLRWGRALPGRKVLIGMGAAGAPSRTLGFTFGSLLTYGHLGRAAAPGQMSAAELGRAIRSIYGRGRS
jgi:3-dehydroquinate dehydratase-1